MRVNHSPWIAVVCCLMAGKIWGDACPAPEGLTISAVTVEGLRYTRSGVVQQELKQQPGSRFSCATWEKEHGRLKDLDVFSDVALDARPSGDSVALTYRFRELPPYVPLLTVNKTDQDGFSLGPHVAALNFLGTAKRVEVLARFLGTTEYQASISGRQLFGMPIEFDAAWIHVDSYNSFDDFHENSHRFKGDGFWPWSEHFGMVGLAEWFWIDSDTTGITLRREGDAVPRLGAGLRFDTRDRVLLPRRGFFVETRVTENGGALGGPADFWEELLDMRGYLPLAARHGLAANALYQYRNEGALGLYDYFHVGGANTLRGYADNSFQGRSECLLNAEYRFDLLLERQQRLWSWSVNYGLQLVAGMDADGLWNSETPLPPNFHEGIYVGFNLLVPGFERVRLEVGSQATRFQVQWDIGLLEKTTIQRFRTR
jgi:outer membrane protein assembly factor BamA